MARAQEVSRKSAFKHIGTYAVGDIIRQLAGFIMLPVYTSYLTPADYGVVALLVVMVSLFQLVMGAQFAQAIPKYYYEQTSPNSRHEVVSTALIMTSLVSVCSTTLILILSPEISILLLGSDSFQSHVGLFGITLLTSAIEAYGLAFFRLQEKPVLFVVNSVTKLIVQLALNIYFVVFLEMGVMGVIVSNLIASAAYAAFAAVYILWHTGLGFDKDLTIKLFRFSWPLWLAGLAALYIGSSGRYFIRIFSGLDDVGLFELAFKFAAILPMLVWAPFSQWWQTERFKLYHRTNYGVDVYPVVFKAVSLALVYVGLGISLFSGTVISLMAADSFHTASIAVPILVIGMLLENLTAFFFFSFLVRERTVVIAYLRYGSGAVLTIGSLLLIPFFGFVGAAVAFTLSQIILLLTAYVWSKSVFDSNIELGFTCKLIAIAVPIVYLANNYFDTEVLLELVAKIIISILVLCCFLMVARKDRHLEKYYTEAWLFLRRRALAFLGRGSSGQ